MATSLAQFAEMIKDERGRIYGVVPTEEVETTEPDYISKPVLFWSAGQEGELVCRAAVITAVRERTCSLFVMNPSGTFFADKVKKCSKTNPIKGHYSDVVK